MHVIVFDNGDPDRVDLIGPFGSFEDAERWARAALDPFGAAWVAEPLLTPAAYS